MKRSEMLLKFQRYYSTTHVMVENNYITSDQFMEGVLCLIEEMQMLPPCPCDSPGSKLRHCAIEACRFEWEEE